MTETAITRVQAFLNAHTSRSYRGDQLALTHDRKANPLTLTVTDVKALLDVIADLCPDHWACEECSDPYCDNCLPDTGLTCPHDRLLCLSCAVRVCRECAEDAREDAATEAYADSIGSRY